MIPTTANDVSRSRNHSTMMMKDESTMKQNESFYSQLETIRTTRTLHLLALGIQITESTGITVAEGHSSGKRVSVHKKTAVNEVNDVISLGIEPDKPVPCKYKNLNAVSNPTCVGIETG